MPEDTGNEGSFLVRVSILRAAPSGEFFPASHASTVFTDTPIYFANNTCVNPVLFLISLISDEVKVSKGITDNVVFLAFRFIFRFLQAVLPEF